MESRPLIRYALKPELAPLHFNQILCNAQSQSGAGNFPDPGIFRSKELLEDFLLIFEADTGSRILH